MPAPPRQNAIGQDAPAASYFDDTIRFRRFTPARAAASRRSHLRRMHAGGKHAISRPAEDVLTPAGMRQSETPLMRFYFQMN